MPSIKPTISSTSFVDKKGKERIEHIRAIIVDGIATFSGADPKKVREKKHKYLRTEIQATINEACKDQNTILTCSLTYDNCQITTALIITIIEPECNGNDDNERNYTKELITGKDLANKKIPDQENICFKKKERKETVLTYMIGVNIGI